MSCGAYRGVKLLEHAMKMVERVLEKRIRKIIQINGMQFGFILWKISHAIWQRNVVSEGKRDVDLEKDGKSNGQGYVWCEVKRAGKFRRTDG